jgi:hypothetical protein
MEAGFFVSVAAMAVEVLLFVATILYLSIPALRRKYPLNGKLWWPVGITAIAGAASFSLSVHYAVGNARDESWMLFATMSALLPLLSAVAVGSRLRSNS